MPKTINKDREAQIGQLVRRVRRSAKLTQEELAAASGISYQQIQKYERGTNRITVTKFIDIMKACDVPPTAAFAQLEGVAE